MTSSLKITDGMLTGSASSFLSSAASMQWANLDFSNIDNTGRGYKNINVEIESTFKTKRSQRKPYLIEKTCYILIAVGICCVAAQILRTAFTIILKKRTYEKNLLDHFSILFTMSIAPLAGIVNSQNEQIKKETIEAVKKGAYRYEIARLYFWYDSFDEHTEELREASKRCEGLIKALDGKAAMEMEKEILVDSQKQLKAASKHAYTNKEDFRKFSKLLKEIILSKDDDSNPRG